MINDKSYKGESDACNQRIQELEATIEALVLTQNSSELLQYPWIGNLGHWFWQVKSNDVIFNDEKVIALGYSPAEIRESIGYEFFTEKIHKDDYNCVMEAMRKHLYGKSSVYEVEYRIKCKNGDYKWFYDRGKITKYDDQGKPLLLAGIVFDITKQKILEDQLRAANEQLNELILIDTLTGVLNRRALNSIFSREIERTKRFKHIFSTLMIDIDYFKKINDSYGHNIGDELLIELCKVIQFEKRTVDFLGRWGGEEFIVILPETTGLEGAFVAEKIRKSVEKNVFNNEIRITVSIGVSESKENDTSELIIERADQALYLAKNDGRNQVKFI